MVEQLITATGIYVNSLDAMLSSVEAGAALPEHVTDQNATNVQNLYTSTRLSRAQLLSGLRQRNSPDNDDYSDASEQASGLELPGLAWPSKSRPPSINASQYIARQDQSAIDDYYTSASPPQVGQILNSPANTTARPNNITDLYAYRFDVNATPRYYTDPRTDTSNTTPKNDDSDRGESVLQRSLPYRTEPRSPGYTQSPFGMPSFTVYSPMPSSPSFHQHQSQQPSSRTGHPTRQPFGPPPMEDLVNQDWNRNFSGRIRTRAISQLLVAVRERTASQQLSPVRELSNASSDMQLSVDYAPRHKRPPKNLEPGAAEIWEDRRRSAMF